MEEQLEYEILEQERFTGERALFGAKNLKIQNSIFADGESPLKECRNIQLSGVSFQWKYPLWYCSNVDVKNSSFLETARAGIWYTNDVLIEDTLISAPKQFRKSKNINLHNVNFTNAEETLWNCSDIKMNKVSVSGDYFAMGCSNLQIENLNLCGNYSFDGCKNLFIKNSKLLSKDAFWNCENVTVYDSIITGEYIAWNSKNLTFVNCTIESMQGFCYIDNLVMKNCRLLNTDRAFEYSSIDVDINSSIVSVVNPKSGTIRAHKISKLVMEADKIDPNATKIITRDEIDLSR